MSLLWNKIVQKNIHQKKVFFAGTEKSKLLLYGTFFMCILFQTWPYLLEKKIYIGGWVWGNADVMFKVGRPGGYKKMLTSADKVGGSKKVKNMIT